MPLSNQDLSNIAKEFNVANADLTSDKDTIPALQAEVTKKNDSTTRTMVVYNNCQVERVTPYETEHRWLDGTTYTTITQQQINDAAIRTTGNVFFPPAWLLPNAQLTSSANGNSKTTSTNSESAVLAATIESGGLISQVNLLLNGQSSAASTATINATYFPGDTSIIFSGVHTFTAGRYLYITGSGTSALLKVTGGSGTNTVTFTIVIAPASNISIGGTAIESIPGFTNGERNTLISTNYQRILTTLTNNILSAAALYNTALTNQLTQLRLNVDAAAQIATAKTAVSTALTAYSTWFAAPSTGANGKWVNALINPFVSSYTTRSSGISARAAQIVAALGVVAQDAASNYSGSGQYLQRFKCLNSLLCPANGPQYQAYAIGISIGTFQQRVMNGVDKLATFSNIARYGAFTANPVGNTVQIDGVSQFANSDSVLITADGLAAVPCTITGISSNTVTLSVTIPAAYTKTAKSGIIKSI